MTEDFEDGKDNGESFEDLLESYSSGMNEDIHVGDRVKGAIISIGKDSVFVDTGTKIDGVVDREELLDEGGALPFHTGDIIELYVAAFDGNEIRLSKSLSGRGSLQALEEAFRNSLPVDGKVVGRIKGGFRVDVMGKRAFCPVSQIDLAFAENPDEHVGKSYPFLILQFEEKGRNIVVSRRELLDREMEKERKAFLAGLSVGRECEGRVTRTMPFGAFVEIFPGIEGLVHVSEMRWSRTEKPDQLFHAGDPVPVK
ncbi:MAG: S1 RNA-binding domain-containing protein, partial [Deltaproteobacteria bacterium]|nr:S1 RNA-binding domain-containing protein [Deltaproteobacteria bacterium]